jgi:hypothetical protein
MRHTDSESEGTYLDEHELLLLLQASRTSDLLDELTHVLDRDGAIRKTSL